MVAKRRLGVPLGILLSLPGNLTATQEGVCVTKANTRGKGGIETDEGVRPYLTDATRQ